jgi:DegV family protein with EDD domain
MAQVRVVTDSTADVPPALLDELGISVVPSLIYLGSQMYQDGVDLSPEEFYARLDRSREPARTAQAPLSSFAETYRRLLDDPDCLGVISIHVAGKLSGTLNGAWCASQTFPDPSRIVLIDSGTVSMGLGWAVVETARRARAGVPLPDLAREAQDMVPRLRAGAMIDRLDNLYQSGRVSRLTALLGTALEIKPLLTIQGGEVSIVGRTRTRNKALDRLVTLAQDWGTPLRAGVLHTGAPELAEELCARLRRNWSSGTYVLGPAGAALATHLGLGAVGVTALLASGE